MAFRIMRWLGIAALVTGYPVLAHYTNQSAQYGQLGVWVALAPLVLMALFLAWRSSKRALNLGLLGLLCAVLWWLWPALEQHYGTIYWIQHAGMQLILLAVFGRTLIAARTPLCTQFARLVHAPLVLSSRHERYTRQVTVAWTIFFAAIALASTALFFLAPLTTWSFFANFLTLPLVALMFIAEYKVRGWALPNVPPTHILDAVRAFRNVAR
jgi:uncharacterized membrane protein